MPEAVNPMPAGFQFPAMAVTVTRAIQNEKLRLCGVDPSVFGSAVDITAFAGEAIMATRLAGISINGSVHVGQTFELAAPIALGTPVTLNGRVIDVEDDPRGHLVRARFEAMLPDGRVPLVMERTSLRISAPGAKGRPGKKRVADVPPDRWRLESRKTLIPERVAEYSGEAENLIHSDPEVARQFGFRAPIAGGLMAVRMMMEALARRGPVVRLQMSVRFRRPMFWDDALEIRSDAAGPKARPHRIAAYRSDGRVACEAQLRAV